MKKEIISINMFLLILFSVKGFSQQKDSAKIVISGYVDAYYAYYTDSVGQGANTYQKFPSISPRSNQFGLNTAMLTAQYDGEKVRGLATLHFGDISRSAWSTTFPNIMEAHAGVRLSKKIWLDAGFFRTHVGAEGLLPKENFTSSVSVCTFYEPYYEAGFRLDYAPNKKLSINLYALNGYNIYEDNNNKKSLGAFVSYALGDKGNIGYSNYIGDDAPTSADSVSHLRIYQNVFFNYQFGKLKMRIGGDYCIQQNSDTSGKKQASMFSGVAAFKYQVKTKFSVYTRGEIFQDPQGLMSGVFADLKGKRTGYKLWGVTAGIEYKPTDNSYVRLEARQLETDAAQEIFRWNGEGEDSRMEVLLNFGISF